MKRYLIIDIDDLPDAFTENIPEKYLKENNASITKNGVSATGPKKIMYKLFWDDFKKLIHTL